LLANNLRHAVSGENDVFLGTDKAPSPFRERAGEREPKFPTTP